MTLEEKIRLCLLAWTRCNLVENDLDYENQGELASCYLPVLIPELDKLSKVKRTLDGRWIITIEETDKIHLLIFNYDIELITNERYNKQ